MKIPDSHVHALHAREQPLTAYAVLLKCFFSAEQIRALWRYCERGRGDVYKRQSLYVAAN